MKEKISNGLVIFFAFIAGGLTMYYFYNHNSNNQNNTLQTIEVIHNNNDTNYNDLSYSKENDNSLTDAVNKVYDAVVLVNTYKDDKESNTGSGFIYKKDSKYGYVMTNQHVVSTGDRYTLTLSNDEMIDATLLGSDEYLDLAVLRIDAKYASTITDIGSSKNAHLGDTVFAIGSPLGYDYRGTVTNGIISGLNRLITVPLSGNDELVMEVIQTDTAVSPGNSGGPLFNIKGEVIGIVSMKVVENAVEGIGFAIPIEDAMNYIDILEKNEKIVRPLIGISMINILNKDIISKEYNIEIDDNIEKGVLILEVIDKTPASKSKLQKGDIITKINDDEVENGAYLKYLLYKYKIGETVNITYYRNGNYYQTKITLVKNDL